MDRVGQFSQGLFPIYVLPQSCNITFNFYIFACRLKIMNNKIADTEIKKIVEKNSC